MKPMARSGGEEAMSVFEHFQERLLRGFSFSDVAWRDEMIRELREALKFSASPE